MGKEETKEGVIKEEAQAQLYESLALCRLSTTCRMKND